MTTHKELTLETAAEQAAGWLPHATDCEVRPERDCTCWELRVNLMRDALEDVLPNLLAQAWEEGFDYARSSSYYEGCNPYTAEAQVDGL